MASSDTKNRIVFEIEGLTALKNEFGLTKEFFQEEWIRSLREAAPYIRKDAQGNLNKFMAQDPVWALKNRSKRVWVEPKGDGTLRIWYGLGWYYVPPKFRTADEWRHYRRLQKTPIRKYKDPDRLAKAQAQKEEELFFAIRRFVPSLFEVVITSGGFLEGQIARVQVALKRRIESKIDKVVAQRIKEASDG